MKNIAIAGFGFMGSMHAQVYQSLPEARLVGVVDSRVEVAKESLKKLGIDAPVFSDLKTLFQNSSVDAVDICLPTDLHCVTALEAIENGKHLFLEKPIARTLSEAEQIMNAVKRKGVRLMIGHCIRFWPEYEALTKFVREQRAGKLLSLSMQRRTSPPPAGNATWQLDEERSLGCVVELHIHDTDFVHHLLGKPKSVTSVGTRDSSGWSHIFTTYEFPDLIVQAEGGWNYPPKWGFQMAFQAVFERGSVEYDSRANPTLTCALENHAPAPLAFDAPVAGSSKSGAGNISSLGGYQRELEYFINCLEQNRDPEISTGEQATDSLRTCFAEIKSCAERRAISLE
ncbi:MAG: Gfo/Idh/MocA family oxidoreductase [Verrucomicrobiota bacterium]